MAKKLTLILKVEEGSEVVISDQLSTKTNIKSLLEIIYETYKWWIVKKAALNNIKDKLSAFLPSTSKKHVLTTEKLTISAKILEDGEEVMENILTTSKPQKAINLILGLIASVK